MLTDFLSALNQALTPSDQADFREYQASQIGE